MTENLRVRASDGDKNYGMDTGSPEHTLRDFALYVGIALLIVIGAVIYAWYFPSASHFNVNNRWTVTTISAALVFGYAGKDFWKSRYRAGFWLTLCVLLLAHFAVWLPLLGRMSVVPLILCGVIAYFEILFIYPILRWAVTPHSHLSG